MTKFRYALAKRLWRLAARIEPDTRCSAFPSERLVSGTLLAHGCRCELARRAESWAYEHAEHSTEAERRVALHILGKA